MKTLKTPIIISTLFIISIYGQKAKVDGGLAYGIDISSI
jgi:hypothetical protein